VGNGRTFLSASPGPTYAGWSLPNAKGASLMGPEWIVVGIIAVAVLFGAKKIPDIARNVGRAQGEF